MLFDFDVTHSNSHHPETIPKEPLQKLAPNVQDGGVQTNFGGVDTLCGTQRYPV